MNEVKQQAANQQPEQNSLSTFTNIVGAILAISYPVLAISAIARSGYQLFLKEGVVDYSGAILTGVAAILYLLATIGFAYRRPWSWRLSVVALSVETILTVIVGVTSLVASDLLARNVWTHFGADYALFPFIQPLLGLLWLTRPTVMTAYRLRTQEAT